MTTLTNAATDGTADPDEAIHLQRLRLLDARIALCDLIRDACPGPHKAVQHRDGRPPWCRVCGYTDDGTNIPEDRS
ncbi:MAG TPA: hypothetical protein VI172_05030 [Candidatus Dormibacteraeota bacterium]